MGGGRENIYILCSRPNVSRHLKYLEQVEKENIKSYQLLLLLEPQFSTSPYAYQYEKIIKQIEDIIDYASEYYNIYQNLGDKKSQEILMKIILFRLTYDCRMHLDNATPYLHYFDEDIISLGTEEIFIDCGGYVGDTLEDFKQVTKNCFKKYYLFEPDKKLIERAKKKDDKRVIYINKGLWKNETKLYFKEQTAAGNGIVLEKEINENVIEIPVTNLDANIEKATFIKMDIEGSELMALKGSQNLIKKSHPKLAICVYHKYEDIRVLYNYINFLGKYKIYLRAEMDNIDTELYYLCIPKELSYK